MSTAQRKRQEIAHKQHIEQPRVRSQRTQEDVLALTDVKSDAKVRRFLVRSLMLSFAQICDARKLCDPSEMDETTCNINGEELRVKLFSGGKMAEKYALLLRGVADALKHKYLHELNFIVYDRMSTADRLIILEQYTFTFVYADDGRVEIVLPLTGPTGEAETIRKSRLILDPEAYGDAEMKEKMLEQYLSLHEALAQHMSKLSDLPDSARSMLRITYTADTPKDYVAPAFNDSSRQIHWHGGVEPKPQRLPHLCSRLVGITAVGRSAFVMNIPQNQAEEPNKPTMKTPREARRRLFGSGGAPSGKRAKRASEQPTPLPAMASISSPSRSGDADDSDVIESI